MKKIHTKPLLLLAILVLIWACGNDDVPEATPEPNPAIASFEPTFGEVKSEVVISGKDFGSNPSKNIVKFGNIEAEIRIASVQKIWVEVPEEAVTGKISVTANGKTVTTIEDFVVVPPQLEVTVE